ncbi:MAG TPA: outer membrane lipoprotein carrier protein LolA [Gemmatimonadaceae bacterium]|nr:outer membrane lipoprotein carrier protein LolA [Gemmatimonadaceae bacterium]
MRKLLSLTAVALAIPAYASAQSAETIIDRAVAAYARLNSMRAEFRQTLTNPLTGTTQTTSGELIRRKPNLLNITFNNGDRVAADGSTLWVYLPSSVPGQVIRVPYTGGNAGSVDPADQFLNAPRTRYTVTSAGSATVGGRTTKVLNLVPKRRNDAVTRAKLWIDDKDYSLRQLEVESANGLKRRVVITSFTSNPRIDRSRFRFSVPRGAKVVDQNTIGAAF